MRDSSGSPGPPINDDPEYPSGLWIGFYNHRAAGSRFRQELMLDFRDGRLEGEGRDGIGRFTVRGSYDRGSREVRWLKCYRGAHAVHYRGFREGRGIWGTWTIPPGSRGGFMIWPRGRGEGLELAAEEGAAVPAAAGKIRPGDRA